jgi:hypothetical protein
MCDGYKDGFVPHAGHHVGGEEDRKERDHQPQVGGEVEGVLVLLQHALQACEAEQLPKAQQSDSFGGAGAGGGLAASVASQYFLTRTDVA